MIYDTAEKLPIRQCHVSRKFNINCIKYSARFLKQGTKLRRTCADIFCYLLYCCGSKHVFMSFEKEEIPEYLRQFISLVDRQRGLQYLCICLLDYSDIFNSLENLN